MAKKPQDSASQIPSVENERTQFTSLLAQNPNYFGTVAESSLNAVKPMTGNSKYEELTCVGFNPDLNRLEATLQIKLPFGYQGNLCTGGSTEYVRFFIDYGGGWQDVGVAAVNVHDIPNQTDCSKLADKPLTYVVTHTLDPKRDYCLHPVLPTVRAILSWNSVPTANPNQPVVWGNVLDRHIQIKPRPWFLIDVIDSISVVAGKKLQLPPELLEVQLEPIPIPDPPPLKAIDLANLYASKGATKAADGKSLPSTVEPHRFGTAEIKAALTPSLSGQEMLSAKVDEWNLAGLDWSTAVGALLGTFGNTTYEQLDCLGLDYNQEWLVATYRIKKPSGFSGSLCQKGSKEYIAFWADWDDTCKWTYLATVSIDAFDFANIPADGINYSAVLPVDLKYHRQNCDKPKIGRVRAVLSWGTQPSTTNPDDFPHWGNRIDAHVQIRPGDPINPGDVKPILWKTGGIRVEDISDFTGLTTATAQFLNGFAPDPSSPFGGVVVIQGPPFLGYEYRIQVRNLTLGSGWTTLTAPLTVQPGIGLAYTKFPSGTGYFTYENTWPRNPDQLLARWSAGTDDLWEIKLDIFGQPGVATQIIQLKNSGIADARININPAFGGNCGTFHVGDTIDGAFVARDPYFAAYSLGLLPFSTPPGVLTPLSGSIQTPTAPPSIPPLPAPPPPPGGSPWTLVTTGMKPCGYVLQLSVRDKAILNSESNSHHWATPPLGFCLLK
jgi:hypothetical protein